MREVLLNSPHFYTEQTKRLRHQPKITQLILNACVLTLCAIAHLMGIQGRFHEKLNV